MSIPADVIKYTRLTFGLRGFLRTRVSLEQSMQAISERLRNRESNFLTLVKKGVYGYRRSPYRRLLETAGCEYGDLERMVRQDGVDSALRQLLEKGVYLTSDEYKCTQETVRGGLRLRFAAGDFENPFVPAHYRIQSSGSRSAGTRTPFEFSSQLEKSYYALPSLVANDALEAPMGLWCALPPSSPGIGNLLRYWKIGKPVAKWFSPLSEKELRSPLQHRLALRYILYGSRLWGASLAKPEFVPLGEARRVAEWMAATKTRYGGCSLTCFVSPAVRVCQAAVKHGLDIEGTRFFAGGEPLTEAKRREIESAGASVTPIYAISEVGRIGTGCSRGSEVDDMHFLHDSTAIVRREHELPRGGGSIESFLFTTLLPSTPKVMLNVEMGDTAVLETRECDCIFGQLGLNQRIHHVRSFTKLTGIGMSVVLTDFVRILETVLPRKYGGASTDYQLLEEEDVQGDTRLNLVISPEVGELDDEGVIQTVLDELSNTVHAGRLAAGLWEQAQTLRVRRVHPTSLPSGKTLVLHVANKDKGRHA
jgi:hypothetical protein